MKVTREQVTLLWALRSPCNLRCRYCYFGFQDDYLNSGNDDSMGILSYKENNDVDLKNILLFISTFKKNFVKRVFIVGGEPLIWNELSFIIKALKSVECEVIVCTNGLALMDNELCEKLVCMGVDAISVSLDSYDPEYNDYWRVDYSRNGWKGVVRGIETLIRTRNYYNSKLKVGVYSVITKLNLSHIENTYNFVSEIGVDYYIFQPVSLDSKHSLHNQLSLDESDYETLKNIILRLEKSKGKITFGNREYLDLVLKTVKAEPLSINNCFAGDKLFFIEPNGNVWDCPSIHCISKASCNGTKSIINNEALSIFSQGRKSSTKALCNYFSADCVNMWQIMAFDEILNNNGDMKSEKI
jgi:MoaA/NifB/PqqE/SkfB family radical SAM enzyme